MDPTKSITSLLDSIDFFDLFGVMELPFFFYFERSYQKSSTSLRLRLAVWNHKFQRGHNPSSFKPPLCRISKTWNDIGSLSVRCFDKVTGYMESIIEP